MDGDDRLHRASWFNPRLRRYTIKERPKSWVYGNYRKIEQGDNGAAEGTQQKKPMPPAPPVRSPLTRLQSVPTMTQMEAPARNKEDKNSEEVSQGEIKNERNGKDKSEANNTDQIRNAPTQEKDFILEI